MTYPLYAKSNFNHDKSNFSPRSRLVVWLGLVLCSVRVDSRRILATGMQGCNCANRAKSVGDRIAGSCWRPSLAVSLAKASWHDHSVDLVTGYLPSTSRLRFLYCDGDCRFPIRSFGLFAHRLNPKHAVTTLRRLALQDWFMRQISDQCLLTALWARY